MKILSLAALPLISLSLVSCTSDEVVDELAGETAEDEALDGKADDAVDGAYTYFEIEQDFRKCSFPLCGGFFLDRLNRASTKCHDGSYAERCYTPELDLSESGLSEAAFDKLREAAGQSGMSEGVRAIVRGRFAKTNSTPSPQLGRFVVTEVWVSQTDAVSDGVFVRAKDNGLKCIAAPCPAIRERALNTSRNADISEIDFAPAGVPDELVGELINDMFQPHGLIVAGDRFTFSVNGRKGKGRTATAAFRRLLETDDKPCVVSGCSGQICADEPMFSTCEWREEYACYATATCERQADGVCGWTQTPELEACLGDGSN